MKAGARVALTGRRPARLQGLQADLRPSEIRVTALCPAAISTEFAIGAGRTQGDPWLDEVLTAEDIASAILTVLRQPRRMRTTQWSMWATVEAS